MLEIELKSEYPEPICQACGGFCTITEEVDVLVPSEMGYSRIELWCYCELCDQETNHPIIANEDYPE